MGGNEIDHPIGGMIAIQINPALDSIKNKGNRFFPKKAKLKPIPPNKRNKFTRTNTIEGEIRNLPFPLTINPTMPLVPKESAAAILIKALLQVTL